MMSFKKYEETSKSEPKRTYLISYKIGFVPQVKNQHIECPPTNFIFFSQQPLVHNWIER